MRRRTVRAVAIAGETFRSCVMRAISTIDELIQELESDYRVVRRPQDPYLYSAPDLLVADYDVLVGVFIPRILETRLPEQLIIRLAASRIALPMHLRCVLVDTEQHLPRGLLEKISTRFDAVISAENIRGLRNGLTERLFGRHVPPISPEVRQRAYWKAEACYAESLKQLETPREAKDPYDLLEQLRGDDYREIAIPRWLEPERPSGERGATFVMKGTDVYVAAVNFSKHDLYLRDLKPYCEAGIALDYIMVKDGKIEPGPNNDLPKILLVNRRPEGKLDRDKPLRAAAFAGWTLMSAVNTVEIERCTGVLSRRLEEVQRWGKFQAPQSFAPIL